MDLAEKYGINFSDYLYYDETSPTCLRWKVDIYSGDKYQILNVSAGSVAGSLSSDYCQVQFFGKIYKCHIIVWVLHFESFPEGEIDHKDGDRKNNKIGNLRDVPKQVNSRNRKKSVRNSSGVTGVSRREVKSGSKVLKYWLARWYDLTGKPCCKNFSIDIHGEDEAFKMAVEYRRSVIEQLNSLGAGYSERHGKYGHS